MKKFVIEDWCGNILFGKAFDEKDTALEFFDENVKEDEREDISIASREGEIKGGKFYPSN